MKSYGSSFDDIDNVNARFAQYPVREDALHRTSLVQNALKGVALLLLTICPASKERTLAMQQLEEAMFWANAAIVRHE